MGKRFPPLNSLRAFEASARHLSFTKAAEELHVTQAAISHQIKSLEEFLGVSLFLRRNRQLLLTDEGQRYWPQIRDMFENLLAATEQVRAQGATGALTVSVVPTFATLWLVPRLADFGVQYPDIDVRVRATDVPADFLREDVDIAIYYGDGKYPGLKVDRLFEEFLTPVCAPGLPTPERPLDKPEDLLYHTLLHDTDTSAWARWLQEAGVKGVSPEHGPVFSHSGMVLQAARHSQGVALGSSVVSRMDTDTGRLMPLFETTIPSGYAYDLVYPLASEGRPKINAFRDWILNKVAEEGDTEVLY